MAPDFQIFADSRIDISIMPALLQEAYTGKSPAAFVSWSGGVGAPHVPIPLRGGGSADYDMIPGTVKQRAKAYLATARGNSTKGNIENIFGHDAWGNKEKMNSVRYNSSNMNKIIKAKQAEQALKAKQAEQADEQWGNNEPTQRIEPNGTVGGARKQRRRPTRKAHRKAHRKTRRLQRTSRK